MTEVLTPNQVLMNGMNKFSNVLVIGIMEDGKTLDVSTTRPTYEFVNYMLNRTAFQINLMEHNQVEREMAEKIAVAENNVAEAVAENIQTEVKSKRGRKAKVV